MSAKLRAFTRQLWHIEPRISGAEVGVYQGINAEELLQHTSVAQLYLVDPYQIYDDYTQNRLDELKPQGMPLSLIEAKAEAHVRLAPYDTRIVWVEQKFHEWKPQIQPLDFVYIDGNHAYRYVLLDIHKATQLSRKGALIGGHNYGDKPCPGVQKAVDDYVQWNMIDLGVDPPDWWIVKP